MFLQEFISVKVKLFSLKSNAIVLAIGLKPPIWMVSSDGIALPG